MKNISGNYSKDKNNIYYEEDIINGVDIKTFKIIDYSYSKDKNNIYYKNNIIKGVDVNSFEILNDNESIFKFNYSKDKYNVFYGIKKIKGADVDSFNVIEENYSKDKYNVFYGIKKIKGADIKTFKSHYCDEGLYGRDKNHLYNGVEIIESFRQKNDYDLIINNIVKIDYFDSDVISLAIIIHIGLIIIAPIITGVDITLVGGVISLIISYIISYNIKSNKQKNEPKK